ncbi:MAG: SDR family NAD(P)-dependent oxidoreductase [Mycobacteriales bacterium]
MPEPLKTVLPRHQCEHLGRRRGPPQPPEQRRPRAGTDPARAPQVTRLWRLCRISTVTGFGLAVELGDGPVHRQRRICSDHRTTKRACTPPLGLAAARPSRRSDHLRHTQGRTTTGRGTAADFEVEVAQLDVTDSDQAPRQVRQVLDRHGRVDVLVNNASRGGVRVAPADRHRAAARGPGSRTASGHQPRR